MENDNVSDISWISSLNKLTVLSLSGNNIIDISGIALLKKLTGYVDLSSNSIVNLSPLLSEIEKDGKIEKKEIPYNSLDLRNNSLDGSSVVNNVEVLLKLHIAGLQTVYITGNNFSENEINQLKIGATINGVTYQGFGETGVIN